MTRFRAILSILNKEITKYWLEYKINTTQEKIKEQKSKENHLDLHDKIFDLEIELSGYKYLRLLGIRTWKKFSKHMRSELARLREYYHEEEPTSVNYYAPTTKPAVFPPTRHVDVVENKEIQEMKWDERAKLANEGQLTTLSEYDKKNPPKKKNVANISGTELKITEADILAYKSKKSQE